MTDDNAHEVRLLQYLRRRNKKRDKKKKYKFNIGDKVRVSYTRRPFDRVYDIHFSGELFSVVTRKMPRGIPVYTLTDMAGDAITGNFYNEELQKSHVPDNHVYKIEKVIKKRKLKGVKQVFVKWLHYPKKINSWVAATELERV